MRDDDKNVGENEKNNRSRSSSKSRDSTSRSRSRSMSSDIDGYRLHIADIGDNVKKSELEKYFSQFGSLKELWMTNSSPCFGFAVFKEKKSASAALKEANGAEFGGQRIRVTNARPRTRGSGRRFYNPNMRCYQCGYSGHFYRDCPELGNGDKRDSRRDRHSSNRRRERDYDYYSERDYDRSHRRSSRRYDDSGSRRSGHRRHY